MWNVERSTRLPSALEWRRRTRPPLVGTPGVLSVSVHASRAHHVGTTTKDGAFLRCLDRRALETAEEGSVSGSRESFLRRKAHGVSIRRPPPPRRARAACFAQRDNGRRSRADGRRKGSSIFGCRGQRDDERRNEVPGRRNAISFAACLARGDAARPSRRSTGFWPRSGTPSGPSGDRASSAGSRRARPPPVGTLSVRAAPPDHDLCPTT